VSSPLHVAFVSFFRTHVDCALKLATQVLTISPDASVLLQFRDGPFAFRAAVIALHACDRLPADQRRCTFELIGAGLPRKIMQEVMREVPERIKHELSEYERQGAWYQDGLDDGRTEGQRAMLLLLLDNRGIALDPEHTTRLETCSDPEQIRRWFERALAATSVADIFTTDS
jgi:hypothetical protein